MMYMMKVMIQVKFWIGICTIIIIYSTDFLLHTLHGGHNLKKKIRSENNKYMHGHHNHQFSDMAISS